MNYEKSRLSDMVKYHATEITRLSLLETVMEEFGLFEMDYYFEWGTSRYVEGKDAERPYLKLEPRHTPGLAFVGGKGGPEIVVTETTPTLAEAARILLPKIGTFQKSFNERENQIVLTGTYNGVDIILHDKPPETCTVETVEEEVEVAAVPAHVEKRVRYVLKGDCDPLLARDGLPTGADLDAVAQEQGIVAKTGGGDDDIPF